MGRKNSFINSLFQKRVKLLRKAKRRFIFIKNKVFGIIKQERLTENVPDLSQGNICSGDWVKVKSKKEIKKTLDEKNKYKGCLFIDEMYEYCEKNYMVLKKVEYFFDEAQQKMCRSRDTVILDGVVCSGRQRLFKVSCDRHCFFFWNFAWIEKIDEK